MGTPHCPYFTRRFVHQRKSADFRLDASGVGAARSVVTTTQDASASGNPSAWRPFQCSFYDPRRGSKRLGISAPAVYCSLPMGVI